MMHGHTLGMEELVEVMRVVMVSTVVTPIATRACVASRLSQKDTQEMIWHHSFLLPEEEDRRTRFQRR